MSSLRVTYRVTADRVAGMQKYLDDIFEQMAAARMGNGQYRLCFAGGYLDDGSRFMYEIQDDAGRTLSRISRMDEIADPKVLKELGGAGHLDDVDDIIYLEENPILMLQRCSPGCIGGKKISFTTK